MRTPGGALAAVAAAEGVAVATVEATTMDHSSMAAMATAANIRERPAGYSLMQHTEC